MNLDDFKYCVVKSDRPRGHDKFDFYFEDEEPTNYVCLNPIVNSWKSKHNKNKFYMHLNFNLSHHNIITWLKLCSDHKLINCDDNYDGERIEINIPKIQDKIDPSRFFIQCVAWRLMKEEPDLVSSVLRIVEDYGVNFYLAIATMSPYCIYNSNHNFLSCSASSPTKQASTKEILVVKKIVNEELKCNHFGVYRFQRDYKMEEDLPSSINHKRIDDPEVVKHFEL